MRKISHKISFSVKYIDTMNIFFAHIAEAA